MFGFFNYYHYETIINIIEEVQKDRQKRRLKGLTMKSKFADDLKDYLNGVWVKEQDEDQEEHKEEPKENIKVQIGEVKDCKNI
tara:strand:- start:17 stop:265 length:249 start_codon:yes stop_codon:yes gene_type:complete